MNKILFPAKMIFTILQSKLQKKEEKDICMIAHRGYSGKYQQNTALAFREAAKHKSGGAETDIRITKDGYFVTNHNDEVVFADGSEVQVADATLAELQAKPIKNTKTKDTIYICTFREYLEIMRDNNMVCFVELKGEWPEEKIKEVFTMAAEVYDLKKVILQSFSFDNLLLANKLFPDMPLMLTYGSAEHGYERCFDHGFSIDVDYVTVNKEMIEQFHSRGLEVGIWTANTPLVLAYCKALGADYIESDYFGG
ncbi:MAG: hypothetical protein IKJ63_10320 [Clostridia bacterium]|nr:hypothetical protein [Clostridia bacterium]